MDRHGAVSRPSTAFAANVHAGMSICNQHSPCCKAFVSCGCRPFTSANGTEAPPSIAIGTRIHGSVGALLAGAGCAGSGSSGGLDACSARIRGGLCAAVGMSTASSSSGMLSPSASLPEDALLQEVASLSVRPIGASRSSESDELSSSRVSGCLRFMTNAVSWLVLANPSHVTLGYDHPQVDTRCCTTDLNSTELIMDAKAPDEAQFQLQLWHPDACAAA